MEVTLTWSVTRAEPSPNRGYDQLSVEWWVEWEDVELKRGRFEIPVTGDDGQYVVVPKGQRRAHVLTDQLDVPEEAEDEEVVALVERRRAFAAEVASDGMKQRAHSERHGRLMGLRR